MEDIYELYQEVILDHNKSPCNYKELDNYSHKHFCDNPLCGDSITIYLSINNDTINDISFTGVGCAISIASASMMTKYCKNKNLGEVRSLFEFLHSYLLENSNEQNIPDEIKSLSGVIKFPMRVKCATMAWHCINEAIKENDNEN